MDEDLLLDDAQAGSLTAYGTLFELNRRKLRAILFKYLRNTQDVDDVINDTFVRAWEGLPDFRREAQFSTWLLRIGINRAKNILVSRRRQRTSRLFDFHPFENLDEITDVSDYTETGLTDTIREMRGIHNNETPEGHLNAHRMGEALVQALEAMPEEYRVVLELREMEGLEYEDIAERLNVPKGTVRSRLSRARDCLREALSQFIDLGDKALSYHRRQE